jgi:predicted ester cyclase
MTNSELVFTALNAIEQGDFETGSKYFADDMTFSGPVPEPISKDAFLNLHRALLQAAPDWKFNFNVTGEEGDTVIGKVQVEGTQTGTLPPVLPGLSAVPATGRTFKNPVEGIKITCRGGLIHGITAEQVPNGGVAGILQQIGVELPH